MTSTFINILLSVSFGIITWSLNAFILRQVSKEVLGTINSRLCLLSSTILFFARESFRRACQKKPKDSEWKGKTLAFILIFRDFSSMRKNLVGGCTCYDHAQNLIITQVLLFCYPYRYYQSSLVANSAWHSFIPDVRGSMAESKCIRRT